MDLKLGSCRGRASQQVHGRISLGVGFAVTGTGLLISGNVVARGQCTVITEQICFSYLY